jgi:hypothetical protein
MYRCRARITRAVVRAIRSLHVEQAEWRAPRIRDGALWEG